MSPQKIIMLLVAAAFSLPVLSQPTQAINDPEKKYKQVKEFMLQEQYALAYPLLGELKAANPENTSSDHAYVNEDVNYYYILCELKLDQPIAEQEAKQYINLVVNDPRRQMLSYQLAKYYFQKEDYTNALDYYEKAGTVNLANEQLADAKFEKAYCYFNLGQLAQAKPLFEEVIQMDDNKYYLPANYYYGIISFRDKSYAQALKSFKILENEEQYKGVMPFYIAETYYLQGKKDEALRYGESVLAKGDNLQNQKELNLLMGQLYFEKKDYAKAKPLLEAYSDSSEKVTKQVMYELSYAYYQAGDYDKAIDGFKQLSSETDSMGQNSMYLLGDCYLNTNQKANARNAFQFCAENSTNEKQQQVSKFNYAKLSYELGFQDIALAEMKKYITDYPKSEYDAEAKEIMVKLMGNTNNFADAMDFYESIDTPTASMKKVYPRILYGRSVELINDQQTEKADVMLTKLLSMPSSTATAYANFWKGELAYRNKNYDSAVRYLGFFVESKVPDLGEASAKNANYDLGYCWLKKEFYPKALGYFEQVTKTVNSTSPFIDIDAYVRSADCYFMNKDFEKAGTMYNYLLNIAHIESDYAWYQSAMIAGIKSSTEKISTLNKLMHLYPKSSMTADVNMEIANTYMADEKFSDAVPYLDKIIKDSSAEGSRPAAYLKLGLSYYNSNRNKEALQYYQELIKKYPESPEADEAMANIKSIYVEDGKPNEYVDLMRNSGKDVSDNEADSLSYASAEMKYNAGDCDGSITGFGNYLSGFPNGVHALDANYFMSECYDKKKDWQNALKGYDYVNSKGINRYFERSTMEAARISYFELKDYEAAKKYFESAVKGTVNDENRLEALRGLVRSYNQLKDYAQANDAAQELLTKKGLSTDDRSIAFLVLGKSQQANNNCAEAINAFRSCAAINKTAWGAEARYEIANCQFTNNSLALAEKSALAVIKETGSYDLWVTKSYILLGDIFMAQKDYFNAKATYGSVAKNAVIPELKQEAQQKLERATDAEKETSKIN